MAETGKATTVKLDFTTDHTYKGASLVIIEDVGEVAPPLKGELVSFIDSVTKVRYVAKVEDIQPRFIIEDSRALEYGVCVQIISQETSNETE